MNGEQLGKFLSAEDGHKPKYMQKSLDGLHFWLTLYKSTKTTSVQEFLLNNRYFCS